VTGHPLMRSLLAAGLVSAGLVTCTTAHSDETSYTSAQVERIRDEATKAGYAEGIRDGLEKVRELADSARNEAYSAGIASTCRIVFGTGHVNPDGWRVQVDENGDFLAVKASVQWWLIGYENEVPMPYTAKDCLARARDYRDGVLGGR
jgi:hypothetical protein